MLRPRWLPPLPSWVCGQTAVGGAGLELRAVHPVNGHGFQSQHPTNDHVRVEVHRNRQRPIQLTPDASSPDMTNGGLRPRAQGHAPHRRTDETTASPALNARN